MYAVERQQWLINHAREAGRLQVAAVADTLSVAPETVRRDLSELERQGLLRRVHGGAVPVERHGFEDRIVTRAATRPEQKARIAEAAMRLLDNAEIVYLDEGSTLQHVADRLDPPHPMTVITNSMPTAMSLSDRPQITVVLLGGRVRRQTLATVEWAAEMLDGFVVDVALLGTNGVAADRGCTCTDSQVAAVKARAVSVSRRVALLADSTRFDATSSFRWAKLHDLNTVVTDHGLPDSWLRRLHRLGVETVVA